MAKIKKLPSGKWNVRVYLGRDETGKVISKSFTGSDRTLLKAQAQEYERTHRKITEKRPFGVMLDRYIKAREGVLSPSTIKGYKSIKKMLEADFEPFFSLPVYDIDRRALQDLLAGLVEDKKPKTIRNIFGLISSVLQENDCPVPHVRLPERTVRAVYSPSVDTITRIRECVKGTKLEIPVELGIRSLRRGEICALDADHVIGSAVYVEYDLVYDSDGNLVKKPPKTKESERMVSVPQYVADRIKRDGCATRWKPNTISSAFSKMLEKNGIPHCRFHDLRRFYVAYLHDKGFSDAAILASGGWKTDHIMKNTYRYALDSEESRNRISEALDFV